MVEGKYCPNCYTFKPLDAFGKKMRNGIDVKQSYCIPCKRLLDRQYKRAIRSYEQLKGGRNLDREDLQQYGMLMHEKKMLEKRISNLQTSRERIEHGFVSGSNTEFPYEPKRFHVSGYNIVTDGKKGNRIKQLNILLEKKKEECEEELIRIQEFINSVKDSSLRVIFTKTFIEGLTQDEVGKELHMDRSTVSKKMSNYFGN